jgi:hypothetical protein
MRDEPNAGLRCRSVRSSDTTKGVSSSRQQVCLISYFDRKRHANTIFSQDGGHGSRKPLRFVPSLFLRCSIDAPSNVVDTNSISLFLQECVTTHLPNELALKMDGA